MIQTVAVRFLISGRVQGVFYRASAAEKAKALELSGWVRNLADGRVELVASGGQDAIQTLAAWLWKGPRGARVTAVAADAWTGDIGPGFAIEPGPAQ